MRTLNRLSRFLGFVLIATFLPLISLLAQEEEKFEIRTFLEKATEEIPTQPKRTIVKQNKPLTPEVRTVLENITEDVPTQPKPQFVSSKRYSNENLKIQLGYFKEKTNVFTLVHKIKKKHNWSIYIKTENNNGTDYYRVMIVDISSRRSANAIMGQLKSEGLKGFLK